MSFDERLRYLRTRDRGSNPLDKIFELAALLMAGKFEADAEQKKTIRQDEIFKRNVRLREVNRLSSQYPDIDPNSFGDPIMNEEDYTAYIAETKIKKDMNIASVNYRPEGGIMSSEAQADLFTYGSSNMRYSLDETATILSYEDMMNYDAWLLGAEGDGKDIAKRHNWKGLLVDKDTQLNGYVIDEDDYLELKEKGIIDVLPEDTL